MTTFLYGAPHSVPELRTIVRDLTVVSDEWLLLRDPILSAGVNVTLESTGEIILL